MMSTKLVSLLALFAVQAATAFEYNITDSGSLVLTDVATQISPIETLFVDEEVSIVAELVFEANGNNATSGSLLFFETFLDGKSVVTGNFSMDSSLRELPTSIDVGTISVPKGGRYTIDVVLTLDDSEATISGEYEAYGAGVALLPLVVILGLAMLTNMVELSLYAGIFLGGCIVSGNLKEGFKASIERYILEAIADVDHAYVYLFTFFLSGLVAMMEKSGGMIGFTTAISKYAKTARAGQAAAFLVGILVFFDDYANTLLVGQTMRPLIDSLHISREKLSFYTDATAAPVASISPVSSWVGFEIGLIQEQIDIIVERAGDSPVFIKTSGFAVFLQSIRYRYYPIFMLVLIMLQIYFQRDFVTMLVAERKTVVYKLTNGGEASTSGAGGGMGSENEPRKDQPLKPWNMFVPIFLLIFLIFFCLVKTGDSGEGDQSFMDKIEASNSYAALLWSTMGAALLTMIFYMLQVTKDGEFIPCPTCADIKEVFMSEKDKEEDPEPRARLMMSLKDCLESFLIGVGRVFPATIVLTLAWASGSIMTTVGCDRLFASWITGGISPESLPTLSFLISLFMALATGTSWGTMAILFPLVLVPTYDAVNGDETLFYSVVAGILSGSVAGDHMSPISDTTVLSALATECKLMAHVNTQAPYALVAIIIAVLVGTLPIGFSAWPNIVGLLIGFVLIGLFQYFFCKPILSPTGAWDPLTALYIKITKDETLERLQQDTIRAANGEDLSIPAETKKLEDNVDEGDSEPSDKKVDQEVRDA